MTTGSRRSTPCAALPRSSRRRPRSMHRVAVFLLGYSRERTTTLDASARSALHRAGHRRRGSALALQPDYLEALTYKNILLAAAGQPDERSSGAEAADRRGRRPAESRARASQNGQGRPSCEPPRHGTRRRGAATVRRALPNPSIRRRRGCTPVRVGGNIRVPTKVKDVKPVYPPDAQSAGVQGVVIIEAVIGHEGSVEPTRGSCVRSRCCPTAALERGQPVAVHADRC